MALANQFPEAYGLVALAMVWAVGAWLTSDFLDRTKRESERVPPKHGKANSKPPKAENANIVRRARKKYALKKLGPCAAIAALGLLCTGFIAHRNYDWGLDQAFGVLTPANDPMPPIPESCGSAQPPPGAMRIYTAGGLAWANSRAFTLITIKGREILRATLEGGRLLISGDIYSPEGDLAHIDQNKFETSSVLAFKPERPDYHTLRVLNRWHEEALNVRFLNPHAIGLKGIFWVPGARSPVILSDDRMTIGRNVIEAPCFANSHAAITVN